ncbi:hypothetical protein KUCAC02_017884 [Chaenocephalus aceratus]|nr:hypothetical protein KUCAC02_026701 [Chaenocephalus aceratus]KAI4799129.1 hypothetical protein KUCAC02_017884 [Chaenocephalus aceratus]
MSVACPWGIFEWCEEGGNYNIYKLSEIKEPRKAYNEYSLGEVVSATFNHGKRAFPAKIQGISAKATSSKTAKDGSLADHDRKRIHQLEETVMALEKSYKSLKKRMRTLEDVGAPAQQPAAVDAAPTEEMCNGQTIMSLEASVSHLAAGEKDLLEVVKILALKVFSTDELRTHSLTGKKTCKVTPGDPRPALDQARFQQLEQQVRKKCGVSHSTFMAKVQNLQKAMRKKSASE